MSKEKTTPGKKYYFCSCCYGIIQRESNKNSIKSYCDNSGKNTRMIKIKGSHWLAKKLRLIFLKNQFELKSFTQKERKFLSMAFEQGVLVTFNGINRNP